MLFHYLKIAFRNMWKYKIQSIVSIVGLAVGFTCFALSTFWIRYEMTFDNFHKNTKQMYVVHWSVVSNQIGNNNSTAYPLAAYLKETFPEIKDAAPILPFSQGTTITVEDVETQAMIIMVDASFFRMFDVKIIEGNRDFLISGSNKLAITQEKAQQIFGNENPIGKKINDNEEICAIVSGMSKQSNYAFDFIRPFNQRSINWHMGGCNTLIELASEINIEAFEKKLYEHEIGNEGSYIKNMTIIPLTKLRYAHNTARDVKFQHILIFAVSGLLVILCSLFNYITLFISRFRMRQKELALRVVCGASDVSLLAMLSIEFLLTLLFAVSLGCGLTQLIHNPFLILSDIKMSLPYIYGESLMYFGSVILISLLIFWLIMFVFRRRSLNTSIRQSNNNTFRKISVIAQLVISIGFAFCAIVILKQVYFLHNTDELGFSFKNTGSLWVDEELLGDPEEITLADLKQTQGGVIINYLKQISEITEVVDAIGMPFLLPRRGIMAQDVSSWDEKPVSAEKISFERMLVSPEYIAFYEFQLIAGEMLTDDDPESMVLINEIAVQAFGWSDPIGKSFGNKYMVKGVIKNVCTFSPTTPSLPVYYSKPPQGNVRWSGIMTKPSTIGRTVLFKYHEGMWKTCKEKIEQMETNELVGLRGLYNSEEEYDNYLKSENTLLKLLSFVSTICILICVFGFVSLVSLTCEERRKEIAIRKINGATVGDILNIFAKEYFLLLIIGAVISFTAGYYIMQRWLENYVKQMSIPAWIYLSIMLAMALVIVLCVGWQVYKTSIENPAEVVKAE